MVRRAWKVVCGEVCGLHQAASILALFTVGSQLLALVRDRVLAHQFGAGLELDLYYAAFRIPDLLYVIFASALSAYVLIPFVSERRKESEEAARALLSQVFTAFLCAYTLLALIAFVLAPIFVPVLFPGFAAEAETLTLLVRILLLQPLLLGISSLVGVVTQISRRFVLFAISPLLYNLGIIAGVILIYPHLGLSGLALGVVLGAIGHLAIQLPFVRTSGIAPTFATRIALGNLATVLATAVPRTFTLSLHHIAFLILTGFASTMAAGSVTVFQFGFNLQSVPLAVIGVSYSVASFPTLARLFAEGQRAAFSRYLMTALRHVIFWSLPLAALLIVIRAQFVRVVLGSGAFNWDDTRLVAAVLALFALSLIAQGANLLIVRALYAAGKTRLPFLVTLVSTTGMIALAVLLHAALTVAPASREFLESLLRVSGVPGTEVLALALAYSIALIGHSVALAALSARHIGLTIRPLLKTSADSLLAALAAGAVAYGTLNIISPLLPTETLFGIFAQGAIAGIAGAAAAGGAYALRKNPELRELTRALSQRFTSKKQSITPPQDEDSLSM
jgi:putative peptidoglycan lipid II flippase